MITVVTTVKGDITRVLRKLGRNVSSENTEACMEFAKLLEVEMKNRVNVFSGYLQGRILAVPINKNMIGIRTTRYADDLEVGVPVPQVSFENLPTKFQRWFNKKSYTTGPKFYYAFRAAKQRTIGYPFIEPSIDAKKGELHGILEKHASRAGNKSEFY